MLFLLVGTQILFACVFFFFSRWAEMVFSLLIGFFFVGLFLKAGNHDGKIERLPEATSGDLGKEISFFAKTGAYWISSLVFYASLFGISYGISSIIPEITTSTLYGGVLSVVSGVLLGIFMFARKKNIAQLFLIFKIHTLLLLLVSTSMIFLSLMQGFSVKITHIILTICTFVFSLTIPDLSFVFLVTLFSGGTLFFWGLLVLLFSLFWTGFLPVIFAGTLVGVALFMFPFVFPKIQHQKLFLARFSGVLVTCMTHVWALIGMFYSTSPFLSLFFALLFSGFHIYVHRQFQNFISFGITLLGLFLVYIHFALPFFFGTSYVIYFWGAFLPSILVYFLLKYTHFTSLDSWLFYYLSLIISAIFLYRGWGYWHYTVLDSSLFMLLASLFAYTTWTSLVKK